MITSGIRIGTPAVTTRGMKESEMSVIAEFIDKALQARTDQRALEAIALDVKQFCSAFPIWE